MRCVACVLWTVLCCVMCSGCGSADADKLRAENAQLQAENDGYDTELTRLEAENAKLEADLADARQELAKIEAIKKGYESGRAKLKEHLNALGPLLGKTETPLPAFEDLKDSDWVDKFKPGAELPAGMKALEGELKSLLGEQGIPWGPSGKKQPKP